MKTRITCNRGRSRAGQEPTPNSTPGANSPPPGLRWNGHAAAGMALAVLLLLSLSARAALPTPLVDLRFSEGSGAAAANSGSLGGTAWLLQPDDYPLFTNNVPAGVFAPSGNAWSLDFGGIVAGQGGRAADLTAAVGDGTLGALNGFTICGWLNARDLNEGWGGNRITFALAGAPGPGFDLVQLANGALRVGINQWPDGGVGGPQSSTGVIKADPQTGAANWVFFAVTYDSSLASGNVKYFFGSPTTLASLDGSHNYTGGLDNGGLIESSGFLTLGNFSDVVGARNELGPNGNSRVFRGLMDEVRIYDRALDLAEVQQAQLNGVLPPVPVDCVPSLLLSSLSLQAAASISRAIAPPATRRRALVRPVRFLVAFMSPQDFLKNARRTGIGPGWLLSYTRHPIESIVG